MIALLVGTAWAAGTCGGGAAAVDEAVTALVATYQAVDELAFDREQKNLVAAVSCLDAVPTGPQIARLHQAMALSAFVNGQTKASRRALASARMMDPSWKLDPTLFPPSHPLVDLYAAATDPGPTQPIGDISPEAWVVDGFDTQVAPVDRSFLLQVRRDGAIVWSGYVYDRVEIPNRGQAAVQTRSAFEPPHQVWLTVAGLGRILSSRQEAQSPAWTDQQGSVAGGGVGLVARYTPLALFGVEGAGSLASPVDPVAGGGLQPSGSLVLVGGGGGWTGDLQPHGGMRLGAAIDRFRAWPADGRPVPVPMVVSVGSAVAGLEAGVRAEDFRVDLAGDLLLANVSALYQARARLDGGGRIAGPLAVEGAFEVRRGGLDYTDGAREAGARRDVDLRFGVGVALWE